MVYNLAEVFANPKAYPQGMYPPQFKLPRPNITLDITQAFCQHIVYPSTKYPLPVSLGFAFLLQMPRANLYQKKTQQ